METQADKTPCLQIDDTLETAHKHCSIHRDKILSSELCGCFYCCERFAPNTIVDWIDDNSTALCPLCGIASVIGSKAGFSIDPDFLRRMHEYWF